ncbi:MAG: hypothetical protein AAGI51_15925 [Pseudomonadota bacterium]
MVGAAAGALVGDEADQGARVDVGDVDRDRVAVDEALVLGEVETGDAVVADALDSAVVDGVALARDAGQRVVAGLARERVVALGARRDVVSVSRHPVVALAAGERVAGRAALCRVCRGRGGAAVACIPPSAGLALSTLALPVPLRLRLLA